MAAPSYLLAAAALLVAAPVISARRSGMIEPFVIGGQDAEPGQFPELVSIQAVGQHMCGGFIIDKYWIVTAGHCLDQVDPAAVSILAGTTDLTPAEGVRMSIGGYEIHEDYDVKDDYSLTHDIALIKMDDPLPIGDNIQIGTLQNIPTNDGDQVVVAGWGWTSNEQQRTSNTLQYAPLQVLSNAKCQDVLSEYSLPDNVICAGSPDSQEAECRGDSGGPLYSDGMVVGIVSWSKKPCGKFPGVYASIARHYDWIRNTSGLESL